VQTNLYDGAGNRVQQVTAKSTFTYSYLGTDVLYQKNVTGSSTTVTKNIYVGELQVASLVGAGAFYFHSDQVGSTRLVKSSSLSTVFSSDYTPFGTTSGASGSETFMYTDKLYDSATGLYYSGARFYDPTIGRFTGKDPASGNDFSYAGDNPLSNIDPTGLDAESDMGRCAELGPCVSSGNTPLSPGELLLLGVIGLTAVNVLQAGLDPFTDSLEAVDIGALLAGGAVAGAVAMGAPVVILGTQDAAGVDPQVFAAALGELQDIESPLFGLSDLDRIWADYNAANDQTNWDRLFGPPVAMTRMELGQWADYVGTMGEDYVQSVKGGSGEMYLLDNLDASFFDESKVGYVGEIRDSQVATFNEAKAQGFVPRAFYDLLSPGGGFGIAPTALRAINEIGFQEVVRIPNEWWWEFYE